MPTFVATIILLRFQLRFIHSPIIISDSPPVWPGTHFTRRNKGVQQLERSWFIHRPTEDVSSKNKRRDFQSCVAQLALLHLGEPFRVRGVLLGGPTEF
jgi:hypothetical protein